MTIRSVRVGPSHTITVRNFCKEYKEVAEMPVPNSSSSEEASGIVHEARLHRYFPLAKRANPTDPPILYFYSCSCGWSEQGERELHDTVELAHKAWEVHVAFG